jgi:RsiW-degrading membrane proteinase PrsW (M82 family)
MCFVGLILSVIVGLIPTIAYAGFVIWLDRYEREPWWLLLLSFMWGAVPSVIMALIAQTLLNIPTTWVLTQASLAYEIVGSSLWAPISEEIAKGLGIILIMVLAHREIDSILDGIIYGALAGLGFAFTENVLYFGASLTEEGWGSWAFVVLLRTVPFGLNHALFTGLTGAGMAAAYLSRKVSIRLLAPVAGLAAGMGFHGIHNLGASLAGESCAPICVSFLFDWAGILMLGVLVVLVWRQEKGWLSSQLPDEVNETVYQTLTSWQLWQGARWRALFRGDLASWRRWGHVRQSATELAFKKQRLTVREEDLRLIREIDEHRRHLIDLGAALPSEQLF